MEKIPWYQSAIVRQQIIALLVAILSITGLGAKLGDEFNIEAIVTGVFTFAALMIPAWTIITRLFKANPPLTNVAAAHEDAVQAELKASKEGGFVKLGALVLVLAVGTACATLGLPQAKTFNERSAAAYATVASVRESTATWLTAELAEVEASSDTVEVKQAKRLALAKDARNIQSQADSAREAIDVAVSLKDLNLKDAEARLGSVITILEALRAYVEAKP